MLSPNYRISGRVSNSVTDEGLYGIRVEAWVKFQPSTPGKLLKSAETAEDGLYQIEFTKSELDSLALPGKVIAFFRLYQNGHLIQDTESKVIVLPGPGDHHIDDLTLEISSLAPGTYRIVGRVVLAELGQAIGGIRVEASGRAHPAAPAKTIGETRTRKDGSFFIELKTSDLDTLGLPVAFGVFFNLFHEDRLIKSTESSAFFVAGPGRHEIGDIALDRPPDNGSFGGEGIDGQVLIFPASAVDNGDPEQATIRLDGATGDILLANADCAEDFDISPVEQNQIEPGHVMVLDANANLALCNRPYDKCVAGVISGAGDYRPGIVLDKRILADRRMPLALVGKVFCRVDANYGAIAVGDLLTTSSTLGHAMRAEASERAFGAVIGKALRSLGSGRGLIPVLVALQ